MYISHARSVFSGVQGHPHVFHGCPWLTHPTDSERDQQAPVARRTTGRRAGSCNIATLHSFGMPSNRSHPSESRAGVICSRRNIPVMTRSTCGLNSPVPGSQDLLEPSNALAFQLRALSGQQRALSCQCRTFQVIKGFSRGDVEHSQGNTGPSQADGVPSWTAERISWTEIWPSQGQHSAA